MYIFDKSKTTLLKAILPILILLHHLNGLTSLSWLKPFGVVGIAVVSIFFFVSGYGLLASYQSKGKVYLDHFITKRMPAVLLPYLLTLCVYLSFRKIVSGGAISEYLAITNFTDWLPYSWFVIELIVFYLLYWAIFRMTKIEDKYKVLLLAVSIVIAYVLMLILDLPIYFWRSTPALALGIIYRWCEGQILQMSRKKMMSYFVVSLVLFVILNVLKIKELNFLLVCVMVIGGFAFVRVKENKLMKGLSKISYEVYLAQSLAIGISQLFIADKGFLFCAMVIGLDLVIATILTSINKRLLTYFVVKPNIKKIR